MPILTKTIFLLVFLLANGFAFGNSKVALQCKADKGHEFSVELDLDGKSLVKDYNEYIIIKSDNEWIMSINSNPYYVTHLKVFVLNRMTGQYLFTIVDQWHDSQSDSASKTNGKLDGLSFKGTCRKQQF